MAFLSTGFKGLKRCLRPEHIEEEKLTSYKRILWYHAKIGEIINGRYEVLGKFGYGSFSTVWFCKDNERDRFVALKIGCAQSRELDLEEREVYHTIGNIQTDHPGKNFLALPLDDFAIPGRSGEPHLVYAFPAAACNGAQMLRTFTNIPDDFVVMTMQNVLRALDFLHWEARCVHTDIKADNILVTLGDDTVLDGFARLLKENPPESKTSRFRQSVVHHLRNLGQLGPYG